MSKYIKKYRKISTIILILLLNSCASNNKFIYGPTITANKLENIEIIGSVETTFETTINWRNNNLLLERSYYELLKAAKKSYAGEIDIKNIIIEKRNSNKNFLLLIPMIFNNYIFMSYTNVYTKGDVIRYNNK
ncbi:hypothetical protein R84B8_00043 [Treponema sp. R8-4-B8]